MLTFSVSLELAEAENERSFGVIVKRLLKMVSQSTAVVQKSKLYNKNY